MRFRRRKSTWSVIAACWLTAGVAYPEKCPPQLKASDADAKDFYGCAVSYSGELLVVGSIGDDDRGTDAGAAYLYERTQNGWEERYKLTAKMDAAAGDQFGYSVALHQGLAVVGAPFKQTRGSASGAAYVFRCDATVCTEGKRLVPGVKLSPFDQYGLSVTIDGSMVAVGVPGADAVDLFALRDGSWQWLQRFMPGPGREAESFGFSVALRDDVLVVGAPFAGAVFVFEERGSVWQLAGDPLRGSASDLFGYSVAVGGGPAGWTAVVGAPDAPGGGAVYVFTSAGESQSLPTRSGHSNDAQLGVSVAIDPDGRTVLAGARNDDNERGANAGAAFVFARAADGGFVETAKLTDARQRAGDEAGLGATIADGVAVVGAFKDDSPRPGASGQAVDSGGVYAFVLDGQDRPTCGPVVELSKTGPEKIAKKSIKYTVSITNRGNVEARRIMLDDLVKEPLELERVLFPECVDGPTGLPCRLGDLDFADDPLEVDLVFSVLPTACARDEITNRAKVTGSNFADVEADSPAASVDCSANLKAMIDGPSTAPVGSEVTYHVKVSRSGTREAELELPTPDGLELLAAPAPCENGFPCDLEDLPAGDVDLDATFTILPAACAGPDPHKVTVQATVSGSRLESDLGDNTDAAETQVLCSDLAVEKDGPSSVVAGTNATYTITVTNLGSGIAREVRLDDSTSPGLVLESVSEPCASGFPCVLGDLAAGSNVQVDVTYRVAPDACCAGLTEVRNEAFVASADLDPDSGNDRDPATSSVECLADLAVFPGVASPTDTCSGESLSYTLVVRNRGPSDVCGAMLESAVETASFSGASCECTGAPVDECTSSGGIGSRFDLRAEQSARCSFTGMLEEASEPYQITATVESSDPRYVDPIPNNSAMASFTTDSVDLALTKTVTPSAANAGNDVTYRFTIVNPGPCTATGVTLDDPVLADSEGILTCTEPCEGGFPCSLTDLPPGERTIELFCEIDPELQIGGPFKSLPILNEARVSADNPDPNSMNNNSSATLQAAHEVNLDLSLTDELETAAPGDPILYTVRLVNNGPSSLVNGVVLVVAPTTAGGQGDEVLGPTTLTLPAGSEETFETPMGNVEGPPGVIVATATVSDPDGFTYTATDTTFVVPPGIFLGATMAGTITVSGRFIVGGSVTYRILLFNRGPLAQDDNSFAELKVLLADELRFLNASATNGTVTTPAAHVVEWNGDLEEDDRVEIELRAQIVDAEPNDEICVQGKIFFDSNGDGVNDIARTLIPGPDQMGVDETCFVVTGEHDIPAAGTVGWILLAVLLAASGLARLRGALTPGGRCPGRGKRAARE